MISGVCFSKVSRRYQIFWEVVGLQRSPFSLVSTIEELLGRKISGSSLENRETDVGNRYADHVALFIRKILELTSSTSGGHSVGVVRSRTQATESIINLNFKWTFTRWQ
jgi:hypothetical protein